MEINKFDFCPNCNAQVSSADVPHFIPVYKCDKCYLLFCLRCGEDGRFGDYFCPRCKKAQDSNCPDAVGAVYMRK